MLGTWLNRVQHGLARSPLAVRMAVKLRNQCRRIIGFHLAATPDMQRNGEAFMASQLAPACHYVVDVGANVGRWTDFFKALAPESAQYLLFEPSQQALARLTTAFSGDKRITIRPAAVGASAGSLSFFEEANAGETSSLVPGASLNGSPARIVPVVTLDDEINARGWPRADYVKIDAEGFDLFVLQGARRLLEQHRLGVVQFEYNSSWALAGASLGGAVQILKQHGYGLYVIRPQGLEHFCYACYGEFFEYANFLAAADDSLISKWLRPPTRECSHLR